MVAASTALALTTAALDLLPASTISALVAMAVFGATYVGWVTAAFFVAIRSTISVPRPP